MSPEPCAQPTRFFSLLEDPDALLSLLQAVLAVSGLQVETPTTTAATTHRAVSLWDGLSYVPESHCCPEQRLLIL